MVNDDVRYRFSDYNVRGGVSDGKERKKRSRQNAGII